MFIGFLKTRAAAREQPPTRAEHQLQRLLQSRALRAHRFYARCEIGPFVVAHVCRERSLIVEVLAAAPLRQGQSQRAAFLAGLGYTVLHIASCDLQLRRGRVLRRIKAALERTE